jgi:hypothetical protein
MVSLLSCDSRLALSRSHRHLRVSRRRFSKRNLSMAQWTMLELEIVKFAFECLMLACFARIVLLREN